MELPNTEAMSIEEKIWFARAIAGMIVADGRVDDSELEFLKEAISFLEDRDQVNGHHDCCAPRQDSIAGSAKN